MTENTTTSTQTNIDINKTFKMFNSARKSKLFSLSSHKHRTSHNNSILTTNSIFLSPNITTTKSNLDSLLEQIKNDKEYSQYKLIKQKITTINKSNIIVKQIDFQISNTPLQFKPHSTSSKQKQHQQLYNKNDFLKLRQQHIHIKKPKDTSIIKEQDLLSSGSYDSDYFDLDDSYNNIFEKKIEAIRSLKYPSYIEDKMKEDIGSLTILLKKINN